MWTTAWTYITVWGHITARINTGVGAKKRFPIKIVGICKDLLSPWWLSLGPIGTYIEYKFLFKINAIIHLINV